VSDQTITLPDDDATSGSGKRLARRALLVGAAATGAGIVGSLVAEPAHAATGNPLILGEENTADQPTQLDGDFTVFEGDIQITYGGLEVQYVSVPSSGGTVSIPGASPDPAGGSAIAIVPATRYHFFDSDIGITVQATGNSAIEATAYNSHFMEGGLPYSDPGTAIFAQASETSTAISAVSDAGAAITATTAGAATAVSGVSVGGLGVLGQTSANGKSGVQGTDNSPAGGNGIAGISAHGTGVYAQASANGKSGVYAVDNSPAGGFGVQGNSQNGVAVQGGSAAGTGVSGITFANGKNGVIGSDQSSAGGYGVTGTSTKGVGVAATSTSGTALSVTGVAKFSRSGTATIAGTSGSPQTSITVTGVSLSASSLVLTTPQGYVAGVSVAGVVPNVSGSSFTIYLTAAVHVSLKIAWFIAG
jgi:hypothetical protein